MWMVIACGSLITAESTIRANMIWLKAQSLGDVAEKRDFTSLSHEMEIPMAEIARHVGGVDQLSLKIGLWGQAWDLWISGERPLGQYIT